MSFLTNLIGTNFLGAAVRYAIIAAVVGFITWLYLVVQENESLSSELEKAEEYNELLYGQMNQLSDLNERNLEEFDRELERREIILESVERTVLRERNRANQFRSIDEGLRDEEDYDTPVDGVLLSTIDELRRIRGLPPVQRSNSGD